MQPIIEVNGLSKKYRLGESQPYYTLRDSLAGLFKNPLAAAREQLEKDEFWALKDVNFTVNKGEVVGIIGRNGAGKSTLLKILSQITPPTEGEVILRGRVGSLLEVGTGFSPELTGRENIYLNGAVLGMKRSEVKRKFDEIVAFSEVEKFLDTPLKHYSSGMYMRLAFAVAAHLEPEILIVDEVLAVGDAEFQKKCLGKMGEVAGEGRTVLFVSHNMNALKSLCANAICLNSGTIIKSGPAEKVVNYFLNQNETQLNRNWLNSETAPGNKDVQIVKAQIISLDETDANAINVQTPFKITFKLKNNIVGSNLNFCMTILNADGVIVFTSISDSKKIDKKEIIVSCLFPGNLLNDERYRVRLTLYKDLYVSLFSIEDILIFEVKDIPRKIGWQGKLVGVVRPELEWQL